MSNYTQSTNFATKDALPSGDPLKIVKGTEINTEFNNISTAIATKADLNSPTLVTPALGTPSSGNLVNTVGLPIVAGTTGTLSVARGGTGVTTSTGTGNVVLSTSPVLVTPALGTPSSAVLTNATGLPNAGLVNSAVTINGNSVSLGGSTTVTATATNALTIGTGLSGTSYNGSSAVTVAIDSTVATLSGTQTLTNKTLTSPTLTTPALGTPASGNLANCTFPTLNQNTTGTAAGLSATLAVASGGTGVTTSTGTGNTVLSNSPTLVTPALGTPASGVLTNATGLPIDGGTTGTLPVARGGTGATSFTSGALLKGAGTSAVAVASAADIVGQIGSTAVTNATNATNASTVTTITTAQVANATAGVTAGAVGTYMMARYNGASAPIDFAVTVAGSDLTPSNATGNNVGSAVTGTWRCMGYVGTGTSANFVTLFLRIS